MPANYTDYVFNICLNYGGRQEIVRGVKLALKDIQDGKIKVNIDRVVPIAKEMLSEIVRIQIDGDFNRAEKYVLDNFVWTDNMELIAQKLQKVSKTLNGTLETELADKLLGKD